MSLFALQSAWQAELEKGSGSALAGSPAFKEARLAREASQSPTVEIRNLSEQTVLAHGWHEVGPPFPKKRLTGTKALGITYEKRVGKVLLERARSLGWGFRDHPWLLTRSGCWLQPDFLLEAPAGGLLFEVKLTYVQAGWEQLARYKKAIWETVGLETVPVLVCKNLAPGTPKPVEEFEDVKGGSLWHLLV
jgi:hypothetical protein